jgi:hypothetical protein
MSTREEAIAAGLLVGSCEYCHEDVWSDRQPFVQVRGNVWHRECAEIQRDILEEALS